MWVFFFFEQKQTERVAGICSPHWLPGLLLSGRKWLPEVLGPHFPECPGVPVFRPLSSVPRCALSSVKKGAGSRSGKRWGGVSRGSGTSGGLRVAGKCCWEGAVAGLPLAAVNPFEAFFFFCKF